MIAMIATAAMTLRAWLLGRLLGTALGRTDTSDRPWYKPSMGLQGLHWFCTEQRGWPAILVGNVPERILALDLGRRRIGMAVSDELGITAQGLPTFHRTTIREDLSRLAELISQLSVRRIVLGLPLHLSGSEGRQAAHAREFGERIAARTGLPVEFQDERLTTVEANRVLRESGISLEKRGKAVDRLSAVLILESWLDHHGDGHPNGETS
jgi:putative Holliday junction resolvase